MDVVSFTFINRQSNYIAYSYYDQTLESCFERLSDLVRQGGQLMTAHYGYLENGYLIWVELPTDVFDGQSMQELLKALQREWELILG